MIRVYRAMCRENPQGPPYGMRIVEIKKQYLGRVALREIIRLCQQQPIV